MPARSLKSTQAMLLLTLLAGCAAHTPLKSADTGGREPQGQHRPATAQRGSAVPLSEEKQDRAAQKADSSKNPDAGDEFDGMKHGWPMALFIALIAVIAGAL